MLGEPEWDALISFAAECLARIRHLLVPDAIRLTDMIEGHAEGRINRPAILDAYQKFVRDHYTPRIVRSQGDDCDIDIGKFDSPSCEAVAAAAYVVVGNLIQPEDDRFHSTHELFWLAEGTAECCRHAVMAIIPDLPWHQEELPPELEPARAALLEMSPEQRRQLRRAPELNPMLHAVEQMLEEANRQREARRNAAWQAEEAWQCDMVREVIAPPFMAHFDSVWRTSAVLAESREIYECRRFDRLPILADVLLDAGCKNEDMLAHCRNPSPHVRGCWALRLCLSSP
jgi:hypothetical protein